MYYKSDHPFRYGNRLEATTNNMTRGYRTIFGELLITLFHFQKTTVKDKTMSEAEQKPAGSPAKASTVKLITYISLFLISGTCSLIFGKLLYQLSCSLIYSYQTESIGRDGQLHHFEKPWFSNFIMFFGMTMLFMKFEVSY